MKKGQVTMFIIIGVALILAFGIMFLIMGKEPEESIKTPERIGDYVTQCIEATGIEGIRLIGRQGGYIKQKEFMNRDKVSFLSDSGKSNVPEIQSIADELREYIDEHLLEDCLKEFEIYRAQGYEVSYGSISSKAEIGAKEAIFEVEFPVTYTQAGKTTTERMFISKVPVRMRYILDAARSIAGFSIEHPLSFNPKAMSGYNLEYDILNIGNETVVLITDRESVMKGKPYRFAFGVR